MIELMILLLGSRLCFMNYDCVLRSYICVFQAKILLCAIMIVPRRVAMLPYINCAGADPGQVEGGRVPGGQDPPFG